MRDLNVKMTQITPLKPDLNEGFMDKNEGSIFSNIGNEGFMNSTDRNYEFD